MRHPGHEKVPLTPLFHTQLSCMKKTVSFQYIRIYVQECLILFSCKSFNLCNPSSDNPHVYLNMTLSK
ncbi:hypothetical protein MBAV_003756 [Candidatus Magnetobacterium bavaricum]|uniref:Uncharacterized protein n=1 Tax=Candidatus Magnetobacterium bavaricum TaxID=29290 RepID=A0A0F3GQ70_9BACT|nr:hypothetical protein MBAV_003756 [Candidatus Magnetobacterium bavaricum]